jgi:hypothetical protein
MEVNTDEIETADKEMQFCYGDDTKFYNIIRKIEAKTSAKQLGKESKEVGSGDYDETTSSRQSATGRDDQSNAAVSNLSSFLQKSAFICETILNEQRSEKDTEKKSSTREQKLINQKTLVKFGGDSTNGANELIRTRNVSMLQFSKLQPNLLLSVHPYPDGEEAELDLRPYKVKFMNIY